LTGVFGQAGALTWLVPRFRVSVPAPAPDRRQCGDGEATVSDNDMTDHYLGNNLLAVESARVDLIFS
jgi:hypothetical protein